MDIFDHIRDGCHHVFDLATDVMIDPDAVYNALDRIPILHNAEQAAEISPDPARKFRGSRKETIEFVCLLNAVNFGSGYRDDLRQEGSLPPQGRFYSTLMSAFERYFTKHGMPETTWLRQIDLPQLEIIFDLSTDRAAARELLSLFKFAWHDYASFLDDNFNGSALQMVETCAPSAADLVQTLGHIQYYQDRHTYYGKEVPIYKRAQITAADLHYALENHDPGFFSDINRLTAFADTALPQLLSGLGVLCYSTGLDARIKAGQPIESGSREEIEIRAVTVTACELMRELGAFERTMDLDCVLWQMAGQEEFASLPRHITKSFYY